MSNTDSTAWPDFMELASQPRDSLISWWPGPLTADAFMHIVGSRGRNEGPFLLEDAWVLRRIDQPTLAAVIGAVWEMAEFPERTVSRTSWLAMFRKTGYTVNGVPAERPAAPVTLYRGATPQRARRMAWTASLRRAQWFADRWTHFPDWVKPTFIYTALVSPSALLCRPSTSPDFGRGEDEYVIDPAGVKIRRLASLNGGGS